MNLYPYLTACALLTACGGSPLPTASDKLLAEQSFTCKVPDSVPMPPQQWARDLHTYFGSTAPGTVQAFAEGTLSLGSNCIAEYLGRDGSVQYISAVTHIPSLAQTNPALKAVWYGAYGNLDAEAATARPSMRNPTLAQLIFTNDIALVPDVMVIGWAKYFSFAQEGVPSLWAGGTLTKASDDHAQFTRGSAKVLDLYVNSSLGVVAASEAGIAELWLDAYGFRSGL